MGKIDPERQAAREHGGCLSPEQRAARVRAAFEAKVVLLETWARDGVPQASSVPENQAELRRCTGPAANFETWADPKIESRIVKHPELAKRFHTAIIRIKAQRARSRSN